jgi:hypothetical protein
VRNTRHNSHPILKTQTPNVRRLDHAEAVQYAGLLTLLATKSRAAVRELDSQNDVTFLRLRSKKHEILVAPDKVSLGQVTEVAATVHIARTCWIRQARVPEP